MGGETSYSFEKEANKTQANLNNKTPFRYNGGKSPRSTALDTAEHNRRLGRGAEIGQWRENAMTSESFMKIKVPALGERLQLLNSAYADGLKPQDLKDAAKLVDAFYTSDTPDLTTIMQQIENMDPIKGPLLKKYFTELLKAEFATSKPNNLFELPASIADRSDHSFSWLNNAKYQPVRLNHLIESALFYEGYAIDKKPDDSGFTMTGQNAQGTYNIYSVEVEKNAPGDKSDTHKVIYSLEDNSSKSVIAFADFISMNRQGNSNSIKLTQVGDPVAFLLLIEELIAVHNMHVELPDNVKKELLDGLAKLDPALYDDYHKHTLKNHANYLIDNATFFSPINHKLKNTFYDNSTTPKKDLKDKRDELNKLVENRDVMYTPSVAPAPLAPAPASTSTPPPHKPHLTL